MSDEAAKLQAQLVMEVAHQTRPADSGRDRVFIREVFDAFPDYLLDGMTWPEFGEMIGRLSQLGLIRTTRADLVGAYGAERVERSAVYVGAFKAERHFIVI